jgi:hypothetical protein
VADTALNERLPYAKNIAEVPTERLASNFVTSLILAKGNLNKYQALTEILIRELRGEPQLTQTK